jgi:hypothetical protein
VKFGSEHQWILLIKLLVLRVTDLTADEQQLLHSIQQRKKQLLFEIEVR